MKRILLALLLILLLCPCARAETLNEVLETTLDALPLREWKAAYEQAFPQGEDFRSLILRLAQGGMRLDAETLLRSLASRFFNALTASAGRADGDRPHRGSDPSPRRSE